jgi:hypothetical protein
MTTLPAAGRKGDCPAWPLPDDVVAEATRGHLDRKVEELQDQARDATGRAAAAVEKKLDAALRQMSVLEAQITAQREMESALWVELWATPQAAQWEVLGWFRDVAQYVRHKVRGELGSLDDAKEARQWSDRLGLNPLAMLRLRWETERVEEAEDRGRKRRAAAAPKQKSGADPRSVLRAV